MPAPRLKGSTRVNVDILSYHAIKSRGSVADERFQKSLGIFYLNNMEIRNDVTFILGKEIQQISFGLYQIQLHFNREEIIIEIGEGLKYYQKDGSVQDWNFSKGRDFFSINNLLEIPVKNAFVDINDNLTLVFENGESLVIKAAKEDTESYIVYRYKDFQVIH